MTQKKTLDGAQGKTIMPLPSNDELLAYISGTGRKVTKAEITRHFKIKGGARVALKRQLKLLIEQGSLVGNKREYQVVGKMPTVTTLTIDGADDDGDYYAFFTPANHQKTDIEPIKILIDLREWKKGTPPGIGTRILAHIDEVDREETGYHYSARPFKIIHSQAPSLLGIMAQDGDKMVVRSIDKKNLKNWPLERHSKIKASTGELVRFELKKIGKGHLKVAHILEALGSPTDLKAVSLFSIFAHGLPFEFPKQLLDDCEGLARPTIKNATDTNHIDMRAIPFITIDPIDARDHDDAVYAQDDDSDTNKGGFIVYVAIADVAHYIRPNSALDKEALKRGNSVYFPDQVVPMLPEAISNDLCSLREGEERYAFVVKMTFDKEGNKLKHTFRRALIKSAAKLSYEEAQNAFDGALNDKTSPLWTPILSPLYKAYKKMSLARARRGPLELDLPERKILMNEQGQIDKIYVPERLDAHKLIEEMMIQANVCAAETLEDHKKPCLYRVHDRPSQEKVFALSQVLKGFDLNIDHQAGMKADQFNKLLGLAKEETYGELLSTIVLRTQSQAEYSANNVGHFGLNLRRYAHFTSPIRRYADLMVHRGLIEALDLGSDGYGDIDTKILDEIGEQISTLERRAMIAERETIDRLVAMHLKDRLGVEFHAKISGVTRVGLFVRLNDTGADGFIPASTLGRDYYIHNEAHHALVAEKTGLSYQLGQNVQVKLVEVVPEAGAMRFEMLSKPIHRQGVLAQGNGRDLRRGRQERHARGNRFSKKRRTAQSKLASRGRSKRKR